MTTSSSVRTVSNGSFGLVDRTVAVQLTELVQSNSVAMEACVNDGRVTKQERERESVFKEDELLVV
jgi:hypothetical protein